MQDAHIGGQLEAYTESMEPRVLTAKPMYGSFEAINLCVPVQASASNMNASTVHTATALGAGQYAFCRLLCTSIR